MQQAGRHDIPDKPAFESLLSRSGISNDTTIVLYGGANNWYAAFAYWLLKIYGHEHVRLMPGGVGLWSAQNQPTTTDALAVESTQYVAQEPDWSHRAFRADVESVLGKDSHAIE